MKVIKDNYNNPQITCFNCKSILEIEKDDLEYDYLGRAYVKCCLCGFVFYLDRGTSKLVEKNLD